jgi:hypothetical protein
MYRYTLIVLACAAISAPAFAQGDLPKCPDGLGPRNRPDCRYLNPPTRPIPPPEEPRYDPIYKWNEKITKPENTFKLPDTPWGGTLGGGGGSINRKWKF